MFRISHNLIQLLITMCISKHFNKAFEKNTYASFCLKHMSLSVIDVLKNAMLKKIALIKRQINQS